MSLVTALQLVVSSDTRRPQLRARDLRATLSSVPEFDVVEGEVQLVLGAADLLDIAAVLSKHGLRIHRFELRDLAWQALADPLQELLNSQIQSAIEAGQEGRLSGLLDEFLIAYVEFETDGHGLVRLFRSGRLEVAEANRAVVMGELEEAWDQVSGY